MEVIKGIFALICFAVLIGILCYCVKLLVEGIINLRVLKDEEKHPGSYPRRGAGIVYNKKTDKLENASGEVILPFE